MKDEECVLFLQWALPKLQLTWPGFRKVRRQVCKRLKRRITELGLENLGNYKRKLISDPMEWEVLDSLCQVTISRFYRDRGVFGSLEKTVIPRILQHKSTNHPIVRCWSIGCASGEEVYTLRILWDFIFADRYKDYTLSIIGTDVNDAVLQRATKGCFEYSTLRDLPEVWLENSFRREFDLFCVKQEHRKNIKFKFQDIRKNVPKGPFDIILCRNIAFTYFAQELQVLVLDKLAQQLAPNGFLVLGAHEKLPMTEVSLQFKSLKACSSILQKLPGF